LNDFKMCFWACDFLIIPDIYASRDSEEDKKKIDGEKFAELIDNPKAIFWNGMKNTLTIIEDYDKKNPASSIILLLWAGSVDNLRYKII
jgi:UDP-N-acetylmuramate-alanine ligase